LVKVVDGNAYIASGASMASFQSLPIHSDYKYITTVAASPGGAYVALGTAAGHVMVWGCVSNSPQFNFDGNGRAVSQVAFSPDGQSILLIPRTGSTRIKHLNGNPDIITKSPIKDKIIASGFIPKEPAYFAASSTELKEWSTLNGKLRTIYNVEHNLTAAVCTPDGKYIIAGTHDGQVVFYCRNSKTTLTVQETSHYDAINQITFSSDGRFATVSKDKKIIIWSKQGLPEQNIRWRADEGYPVHVDFSECGTMMAIATSTGSIGRWDISTGSIASSTVEMFVPDGSWF